MKNWELLVKKKNPASTKKMAEFKSKLLRKLKYFEMH